MEGPEEFCRKIDSKFRRSIIITFAAIFFAACGASLLIYNSSFIGDFTVEAYYNDSLPFGNYAGFLMGSSQSDGDLQFYAERQEISDGLMTAIIEVRNGGNSKITIDPRNINIYLTDVKNGGKPKICRCELADINGLSGSIDIPSGTETEFTIYAVVPDNFFPSDIKASAVIWIDEKGTSFGLMF